MSCSAVMNGVLAMAGACLLAALTPALATAQSVDLPPTLDFTISDSNRDGFDTIEDADLLGSLLSQSSSVRIRRIAIEFDISSLPSGSSVESATLELRESSRSADQPTVDVYAYTGDGVASLSDATSTATLIVANALPPVQDWMVVDDAALAAHIEALRQSNEDFAGILVKLSSEPVTGNHLRAFAHSESTGSAPILRVALRPAVPALSPLAIALLTSLLFAIPLLRLRQARARLPADRPSARARAR